MSGLVPLIILIYVFAMVKKAKRASEEANGKSPKTDESYQRNQRKSERKANKALNKPDRRSYTTDTYGKGGHRTTGKPVNFGGSKQATQSAPISSQTSSRPEDLIAQGDILTKANAEVKKQHTDDHERVLGRQMKHVGEAGFGIDNSPEGTAERMKKVKDLMITGYGGNIEFQRDFIAEGMDMLNKISTM